MPLINKGILNKSKKTYLYPGAGPFSVFFQAIQALTSNISPSPGFRWNVRLAYML